MTAENPFVKKAPARQGGGGREMTLKENGPLSVPTGKGPATKNSLHENLATIRVKAKGLIVEAASRGFVPPSWATFALRVLKLAAA